MAGIMRLSGSETRSIKLDLKDKKIMAILVDDARISTTQLAKKVGLKRETVDYRIKRLIEQKFITGFIPMINFKLLGYSSFEVFILLNEKGEEKREEIITKLANFLFTQSILEYNDKWDIKHTILAKNIEEFDLLNEKVQTELAQYISERERSASLKSYFEFSIGELFQSGTKSEKSQKNKISNPKIDEKDISILKNLSKDCRQSTYQIGEKVGLSPDGVGLRIKKMVENEVIEKFMALFDYSKIPLYWYTFAAQLKSFDPNFEKNVHLLFRKNHRIMSARKTLGNWDILFSIVAESQKEIHEATKEIKKFLSSSLKTYQTFLAYKEPYFTAFPEVLVKPVNSASPKL